MLNKVSSKLAKIIADGSERRKEAVYTYGIEIILSTMIGISSILIVSGLLHEFKLGVIFLLVFAPLRVFTGGYHAVTYFRCFLISNISYLFLLLFNNIIYTKLPLEIWLILLVLSSYYIAIHAPVVNENQPIGENKKSRCKIMARNILNINVFAALFLSVVDAISEIKSAMENEHILQAPPLKTLTGDAVTELDDILENKVENVTLEVTEKCNLRCKYCIYHPSHPEYRAFGHENMKWDVAKKAIDFLKEHSQNAENRHIGFYGGEPLLNFELIERAVEYAKKLFGEDMSFAITTNATLVNDKIAEYFAKNNFNIIISLDGPQEMHDANRLMVNGTGSFEKTVMGAKKLFEAFHKEGKSSKIGFNMVVSGPGYLEQYTKIQEFIEKSEWIPKDVMILTATVDHGPSESDYFLPQGKEDRWFMEEFYEPLMKWEEVYKSNPDNTEKTLFTDGYMDKGMMIIHKRLLTETPIQQYGMNGCCVPGQRRIYVTTKGEFLHCEKVGNIPCLGNVNEGFDKEKIKKLYVEDFIEEAKEYCKECWAVNLCTLCYVNCYDANGLHLSYRHNSCRNERKYLEDNLRRYHALMEANPSELEQYNEMEIH